MRRIFLLLFLLPLALFAEVKVGLDVLFEEGLDLSLFKGKKIGLISNQTAINRKFETALESLKKHEKHYQLVALFAPEHGFYGDGYADEQIRDKKLDGVPVYSLHGQTRRPSWYMLDEIDILVYDIQDIGSRSYSYITTLFYCMEEAATRGIKVVILDRPNPLGGTVVDGSLLDEKWRSFLGYINVPYCHGMTIGELAKLFNQEYHIKCNLEVIPMRGWKRWMTFKDTELKWIPTSPQIPEADTPFFYATTGLIGHCSLLSMGVGYTLPFKVLGAPWIHAERFVAKLNEQKLPGVLFHPFYFKPFFGKFKAENCQGARIIITDPQQFLPVTTQFTIMGVLKSLYPQQFEEALQLVLNSRNKRDVFNKLNGSEEILRLITEEKYFTWKIRERIQKDRARFLPIRKKYLNPEYS